MSCLKGKAKSHEKFDEVEEQHVRYVMLGTWFSLPIDTEIWSEHTSR